MNNETRDLIESLADGIVTIITKESTLGDLLRNGDDGIRSEVAYYLDDILSMHPQMPSNKRSSFTKIQEYIGHLIGVANWEARLEEMEDELQELNEYEFAIIDDLEGAP